MATDPYLYAYPPLAKWTSELLTAECAKALDVIGIYGISAYAQKLPGTPRVASRSVLLASGFVIHPTPLPGQPDHITIEIPRPVSPESVDSLNMAFGM